MSPFKSWSWPLFGVVAITVACSSSSSKKTRPTGDAGAAGAADEQPSGDAGTGNAPSEGGAAGESAAPPTDAGAAGAAGASTAPLSLADLAGDWSGTLQNTYVCESSPQRLTVSFEDATVTIAPWPNGAGSTGTIEQKEGSSFELTFEVPSTEFLPGGTSHAQLFVEPTAHYALLVTQELDTNNGYSYGNVALLERDAASDVEFTDADLVGKWSGVGVRLDAGFAATESFDSSATFALDAEEVLSINGEDAGGTYASPAVRYDSGGVWESNPILQSDLAHGGVYLMSSDKRVIATALLKDLEPEDSNSALCDLRVFTDMSPHKFALWAKVE